MCCTRLITRFFTFLSRYAWAPALVTAVFASLILFFLPQRKPFASLRIFVLRLLCCTPRFTRDIEMKIVPPAALEAETPYNAGVLMIRNELFNWFIQCCFGHDFLVDALIFSFFPFLSWIKMILPWLFFHYLWWFFNSHSFCNKFFGLQFWHWLYGYVVWVVGDVALFSLVCFWLGLIRRCSFLPVRFGPSSIVAIWATLSANIFKRSSARAACWCSLPESAISTLTRCPSSKNLRAFFLRKSMSCSAMPKVIRIPFTNVFFSFAFCFLLSFSCSYLICPKSWILHTGGFAKGETSTKSNPFSWAMASASWIVTIPRISPFSSMSRMFGAVMNLLILYFGADRLLLL